MLINICARPHDGDIVVAEIDGEYTAKVYFTDEDGHHWLCPMNKRFQPILLTESMNVRISGVVRDCSGYEGSVSDFERKAMNLSLPLSFKYECSVGKVQRTISNHPYMRLHVDKWKDNGASIRETK